MDTRESIKYFEQFIFARVEEDRFPFVVSPIRNGFCIEMVNQNFIDTQFILLAIKFCDDNGGYAFSFRAENGSKIGRAFIDIEFC